MTICRLVQVEVRDFKSFGGEHVIGPFRDFTGIVGPNGSGKSNVLDALAFALYLDKSPRSTMYIHNVIGETRPETCSVKVTIEQEEGKKKKKSVKHTYERVFDIDEKSTHYIDGKEVDEDKYKQYVLEKGFHPLIFVKQTDVDAVARKTPIELTQLFEEMSGSKEYAERYDELRIESEAAHEAVAMIEKRRRAAISEKKHISDRKDEASKYRELAKEEEDLQIESYLFQLFHMKRKREETELKTSALQQQQMELSIDSQDAMTNLKSLEVKKLQTTNNFVSIDRKFKEIEQQMRDANLRQIRAKEEEAYLTDRVNETSKNIDLTKNAKERRLEDLERYKKERDEISQRLDALPVLESIENEISEYNMLREQASKQFDDITQALRNAMRDQSEEKRHLEELKEQLESYETTRRRLLDTKESTKSDKEKASTRYADIKREIDDLNGQKKVKETQNNTDIKKQTKMQSQLKELERKYEEVRRVEGTNTHREKHNKVVSNMQKFIPAVYGKFSDLVKPAHSKYEVAAATACGGYSDYIVVKDRETAIRGLEFAREQGVTDVNFLPMQNLKPFKVTTKKTVKRLLNFMVYDPMYAPVAEYVFGHIAVADNIAEASRLAFEENINVVTFDGASIDPRGIYTIGTSRNKPRYSQESSEQIEEKIKKLEKELGQLGDIIEKRKTEIELIEERLLTLQPQMAHRKQQVSDRENRLNMLDIEIRSAGRKIDEVNKNIQKSKNELQIKQTEVDKVSFAQAKNDATIFKDFCSRVGVKDVKEFEITRLQDWNDRHANRRNLQTRLSYLNTKISDIDVNDSSITEENLRNRLSEFEKQLHDAKTEVQESLKKYNDLKIELEEVTVQRKEILDEDESNRTELKEERRKYQEITEKLEKCTDELTAAEHEKQAAKQMISSILQQCKLNNVKLPHTKTKNSQKDSQSIDSMNTPSSLTQEYLAQQELDSISFKSLTAAQKVNQSPDDFKKVVKEYEDKLVAVRSQISRIHPDLKSDDRYTEVEKELEKINNDQEELRQKASRVKKEFIEVKNKRKDLFMQLYDSVDQNIDKIYKKLTRVRNQENRSGTAYLALEDTEEPYLGGIKYTAMPPHKRFRDLEQLSGGEKAVASLALVIALQKNTESPFILMDEPDASLDKLNLRSAATALNEISKNTQIISVSLRDKFFEHSDVLVGIYKDKNKQSSGVITINLSEFIEQNLEMEALE